VHVLVIIVNCDNMHGEKLKREKIREISGGGGGGGGWELRNLVQFWVQNVLQVLHNKFHELLKSTVLIYVNRAICLQWATISKYLHPPQGMWSPPSF